MSARIKKSNKYRIWKIVLLNLFFFSLLYFYSVYNNQEIIDALLENDKEKALDLYNEKWNTAIEFNKEEELENANNKVVSCGDFEEFEDIPIYNQEEFDLHTCDNNNLWILLNGYIYDVQNFRSIHPGGEMICLGEDQDAFELFSTIHSEYVMNEYVNTFCIGRLEIVKDQSL
eukprot:TRINITY_DN6524_c0_g1_i1.p1 TRINITY_DN6524_c0_g1~~TRINITY_DN6524_c0_g1_i1.p1  ORF type:complete len:173 (+),score=36.02 TRINITY_DN6524_c0_g1_i1:114-632(+)